MLRGDVLLVSKNVFLCEGLVQALAQDTLSVAGRASSPEAALSLLQSGHPHVDLIVFDADTSDGTATMKAIADQYPDVGIIIITSDPSQIAYEHAAEIKAKAMLPNTLSAEALNLTLQLVILGENLFLATGDASGAMRPAIRPPKQDTASTHLSSREAEILSFIKRGCPNKVIARELDVAEATVKVHVKSLLRKIDVGNRTQAAVWAMSHLDESEFRAA
jgi:two-component system, NarL family, nitrate/nitrite response regulator NarL